VNHAAKAIEFYKTVFGAKEILRLERPTNKVAHAELKIGDTRIMLADECPEMGTFSPDKNGTIAMMIYLYVKNVDTLIDNAIAKGATLKMPAQDMFYGDRNGSIVDPFGHQWCVATHIEDVSHAKVKKRMAEMNKKM